MTRPPLSWFFSLGLICAFGCGTQEASIHEPNAELTSAPTWAEFRARHAFREPASGMWIADGDTLFSSEKQLREFYEQHVQKGQLIVNRVGNNDDAWDNQARHQITYCVSEAFGAHKQSVVTAMQAAALEWMAAADVKFVYQPEKDASCSVTSDVVFDVQPVTGAPYIARAFFPSSPRAARQVLIGDSAFVPASYTLVGVLRHELGHTLGFRHEHTRPETGTCFENSEWRALTPYDQASVMHYPQCNGISSWALELTALDEEGAATLYGAPGSDGGTGGNGTDGGTAGTDGGTGGGTDGGSGDDVVETISGSVLLDERRVHPAFSVQPGTLFKAVLTGTGDPDLYVRFGEAPTMTDFHCRPYLDGSSESCALTVPQGVRTAYVMLHGYAVATYSVEVTHTPAATIAPLPGETCATALPIGVDGAPVTGNLADYAADGTHCTTSAFADRFYTFTLAQRSKVTLARTEAPGASYEVTLEGPSETACATAPHQACRAMETTLNAGTYYLVVAAAVGTQGSYQLSLTATPVMEEPPPSAESCDAPGSLTLVANTASVVGTTVGKRHDRTGTCGGALGDVVYALTIAAPGTLTVSAIANSAGFRPVVYVQSAVCSTTGNLKCNAAKVGTTTAQLTSPRLSAGQYFIWVDGIGSGGGTNGSFKLDVTFNPATN